MKMRYPLLFVLLLCATSTAFASTGALELRSVLDRALEVYNLIESYQVDYDRRVLLEDGTWRKESVFLKFQKPFIIYMKWKKGKNRGLQLLFAKGHFNERMKVRPPGLFFGILPLVELATDDPRVKEGETHSVEAAGLGPFLRRFHTKVHESQSQGNLKVLSILRNQDAPSEITVDVEFENMGYDYPRMEVTFSTISNLPISMRLYNHEGILAESMDYYDLAMNAAANDPLFMQSADLRLFDLFQRVIRKDDRTTQSPQ